MLGSRAPACKDAACENQRHPMRQDHSFRQQLKGDKATLVAGRQKTGFLLDTDGAVRHEAATSANHGGRSGRCCPSFIVLSRIRAVRVRQRQVTDNR